MKNFEFQLKVYADCARDFFKAHNVSRCHGKKISQMNDNDVIHACHNWCEESNLVLEYRNFEGEYLKFHPEWYWVYGLHDAEILQVSELELIPDYKIQPPIRNCLEITLDASSALFDTSIRKISLYNYKIISSNINDLKEKKVWWIGDTLSCAFNDYLLNIEFEKAKGNRFYFQIKFQNAVVERT